MRGRAGRSDLGGDLAARFLAQLDHLGADRRLVGVAGQILAELAEHVVLARLLEVRGHDRQRIGPRLVPGLAQQPGDEARTYALTVMTSDFEEPGEDDVFRKLSQDLGGKADEATIRAKMVQLRDEARRQVASEG